MRQNLAILLQSVAVGAALVLVPATAGTTVMKQPLISLGASGTSAQPGQASEFADAKMIMPNPFTYVYEAGDALSDEAGTGQVYELQLSGEPKAILQRVADALGVQGSLFEPEYSNDQYRVFVIGSKDGSGASATINWSGTGSWWFNEPQAYPTPDCNKWETAEDGANYCGQYAEQKPTPELLPSKDQMITEAAKIFSAVGQKVSAAQIQTSSSDWGASAYSSLQIGGQDSPIEWTVSWGPTGKIGSVSGHSVKAVSRGDFKTISDKAAVGRVSDWRYSGQLAQSVWAKYQTNPGGEVIAFDGAVKSLSAPEPFGEDLPENPEPDQSPAPSPTPINVTVNNAIKAQLMIWDKSGKPWIVPGVMLFADQGWLTPVFNLEDGVVELPDPVEVSPMLK